MCKCNKDITTKLLTTWSYNSRRVNGILLRQVTDKVLMSWFYWGIWADIVKKQPPIKKSWCRFERMSLVVCFQCLNCLRQQKYCKFSRIWWIWCGAKFCASGIIYGGGYYCLFQRWMCIFSVNLILSIDGWRFLGRSVIVIWWVGLWWGGSICGNYRVINLFSLW